MEILIAPNAFKNSLDATAVANAIQKGLMQSKLSCTANCFPIGDGGDGTAALLLRRFNGTIVTAEVHDPLGKKINTSFGLIDEGKTAIIEMADASGLRLLKTEDYDPLHATTFGTGELIIQALNKHVNKIIIGIGGSATVDGSVGILEALGARFLDDKNKMLMRMPESLSDLAHIDLSNLDKRIFDTELIVLCDVDNILLGDDGAAIIFGPQKGASVEEVKKLEAGLAKLRDIALHQKGIDMSILKYGGAAGGTAAGLSVFLDAKLVNGIEYFLDITAFDEALQKTDLVITGEGSIDLQTLQGKGPFGVACRAKKKNIPVIGVAGKIPLVADIYLQQYFDVILPINNEISDMDIALQNTSANLTRTAKTIGDLLAIKNDQ